MTQVPNGPEDRVCPFHRRSMHKVCIKCPLWTLVRGTNPQTGAEVDRWDCSFAHLPMLLIETSKNVRGVQAAQETTRNEIVKGVVAIATTDALHEVAEIIKPPEVRAIEVGNELRQQPEE